MVSASRSRSVPAVRNVDKTPDIADDNTEFPELPPDSTTDPRVPTWLQELTNARVGRQSRASSVVSTRTRFSTTTFDDARSIDIQAGGQTFRISRHGDSITDATAPPPYSGPVDESFVPRFNLSSSDKAHDGLDHSFHARHHHHGGMGKRHPRRVRIAMPEREDITNANDDESIGPDTPTRVLTDQELRQIILDLPSRLKNALGIRSAGPEPDAPILTRTDGPDQANIGRSRNHNFHFPPNIAGTETHNVRSILRNAPENAPYQIEMTNTDRAEHSTQLNEKASSPADQNWNNRMKCLWAFKSGLEGEGSNRPVDSSQQPDDIPYEEHENEEVDTPSTVGDLNELSQVYNRVIRDLDREHRKQLHEKDKELDQLRIRLHEKDIVYRQELKGRDFVIDDLMRRMDASEETLELKMERARNEVEELWELRWKEHRQQLMEKCGLIKSASHAYSESGTQTDA